MMAQISLFTYKQPVLNGLTFDAILEDTFELNVTLTGYPIEIGARATDHRIVQPIRWRLIGAVSNTPLNTALTDFIGGVASNYINSGIASTVLGMSAGILSGSDDSRASAALEFLIDSAVNQEPFDVDAGDIQLKKMQIIRLRRTKNPENEQGLIFEADLQEYMELDTAISVNTADPNSKQKDGTPEKSAISSVIDKGRKALQSVGTAINNAATSAVNAIEGVV